MLIGASSWIWKNGPFWLFWANNPIKFDRRLRVWPKTNLAEITQYRSIWHLFHEFCAQIAEWAWPIILGMIKPIETSDCFRSKQNRTNIFFLQEKGFLIVVFQKFVSLATLIRFYEMFCYFLYVFLWFFISLSYTFRNEWIN